MIPTRSGILLLLLDGPLIALAGSSPLVIWPAMIYLALVLVLFGLDWRLSGDPKRFTLRREHETRLSLGENNPILLHFYNPTLKKVDIWVRDEPPEAFQAGVEVRNAQVAPQSQWETTYSLRPLRRGDYRFGDLNLRWRSPLGLLLRQARFPAGEAVKVYPNLRNIQRYDLLLKRNRLQEMGLRQARQLGEGTEFERLREYLPDDDFRRIDWKATSRRNRPITIEYQTERSQNVMSVIDTGRMMQSPVEQIAKLDYVINAVLLLSYVASGKGDKVGLMTFADEVGAYLNPHTGRGQFYRMLETLYAVEAQPVEPDYRKALSYLTVKQRKRALVVIFTDLSGEIGLKSLINHASLLTRTSLPLVVTISDPDILAAANQAPDDSLKVYQRATATQLLEDRQVILNSLNQQGILTLDVPANHLTSAVINRYLALKGRMSI